MKDPKPAALTALYEEIWADPNYRNERMGRVFVPGDGPATAAVAFVGEAPGREEERLRRPFVGAAGNNLNVLLAHIGWQRSDVYITNLTKFRPFHANGHNRKPTAKESRVARPYLIRELQIVAPAVVVCLGSAAASALLQQPGLKMQQANGTRRSHDGLTVFVTYHPSPFNFHNPLRRKALFSAFDELQALLAKENP